MTLYFTRVDIQKIVLLINFLLILGFMRNIDVCQGHYCCVVLTAAETTHRQCSILFMAHYKHVDIIKLQKLIFVVRDERFTTTTRQCIVWIYNQIIRTVEVS